MRYLKKIIYLGLVYKLYLQINIPAAPSSFGLIRYGDSSYARDLKNKKCVMSYYYYFNGAAVSWYSKKQRTVSTLTTEAKYITFRHAA